MIKLFPYFSNSAGTLESGCPTQAVKVEHRECWKSPGYAAFLSETNQGWKDGMEKKHQESYICSQPRPQQKHQRTTHKNFNWQCSRNRPQRTSLEAQTHSESTLFDRLGTCTSGSLSLGRLLKSNGFRLPPNSNFPPDDDSDWVAPLFDDHVCFELLFADCDDGRRDLRGKKITVALAVEQARSHGSVLGGNAPQIFLSPWNFVVLRNFFY